MLPKQTSLGDLTVLEIYEFYNMPVLFACQNRIGHLYLAVWIEETDQENRWLYVPLSPQRFVNLRQGREDLHRVFVQPEDGFVFKVSVDKTHPRRTQVEPIPQEQVDESWAPLPDDYIDLATLPRVVWENVDQRTTSLKVTLPPVTAPPVLTFA